MDEDYAMQKWTKRDIFKIFNKDNDKDRVLRTIAGGYSLIRNSAFSREFISEWQNYCQKQSLIDDSPSENEHPEFIENRHDQALLAMLYYKYKDTAQGTKLSYWPSERITEWDLSKDAPGVYFITARRRTTDTNMLKLILKYADK